MKIKLRQITGSVEALKTLIGMKLPIAVAYNISKLIPQVDSESKFYEEKRMALVKEYGAETEVKGNFQVTPENLSKFVEELNDVGELEVELNFNKVKISDLGDATIEPKYLIDWLFEE